MHNYSPSCIQLHKKIFENLLPVRLLVRTNLFIPSRFWTTHMNFDTCYLRYIATCGKKNYIGAHLHFRPKPVRWNFLLKISQLSIYEVVRTNFSAIFGLFAIFDRNFGKILAPPSDEYENYVVHLKEQSLSKKCCKLCRNRPINGNAMFVQTMYPSTA